MKKKTLGIGVMTVAATALAAGTAFATQPYGNEYLDGTVANEYVEKGHKVTICHRTGSASNPYVVITVDVAAINGKGVRDHDRHDQVGNGPIGDIIPPVAGYNDDGKNWDGQWTAEMAQAGEVTAKDCTPGYPAP